MSGIYKSGWGSFVAMNAPVNECEIESIEKVLYTIHMFPLLLAIGPVTIYTMSVFNVIAFFAVGYVYWQKGREEHYQEDELFDGFLLAFLWGLLWGRIGFIVLHFAHFGFQPLRWLDMFSDLRNIISKTSCLMDFCSHFSGDFCGEESVSSFCILRTSVSNRLDGLTCFPLLALCRSQV